MTVSSASWIDIRMVHDAATRRYCVRIVKEATRTNPTFAVVLTGWTALENIDESDNEYESISS